MNSAYYRSPGIYDQSFEVANMDYERWIASPYRETGYYESSGPGAYASGQTYAGYCSPGAMAASPYWDSGYEPARPKTYASVLAGADYRSPGGMAAAPHRGHEYELAKQKAEFLEEAGVDYGQPGGNMAERPARRKPSPGETASLDEMVARVEAEDSGVYRGLDNSYGGTYPESPCGPIPSTKPEDGFCDVRECLKEKCDGGECYTQKRYADEKSLSSTDFDDMEDTKKEAPYRDADADYDDIEGNKPYDLGVVREGKRPRGESWADTALNAAKFMTIFTAGTLIAYTVYSALGFTHEFPPFVTGSSSMEMITPADGSCGM